MEAIAQKGQFSLPPSEEEGEGVAGLAGWWLSNDDLSGT